MKEKDQNELSDSVPAEANRFAETLLQGRHIASLATQRPDGSLHQTAVWYLFQDGILYIPTNSRSQKVRNVETNPIASVMIDTRTPGLEQGVSVSGQTEVIRGEPARTLVAQAQQRYLTQIALDDPEVGPSYAALDDVVIALKPTRWLTWDIAGINTEQFGEKLSVESGYLYPRG